jgi:hypothetical protein
MHRHPRDCDTGQEPVHHPTTPHQRDRSPRALRIVPKQSRRLGTQAHRGPDMDQSTAVHPRSTRDVSHQGQSHQRKEDFPRTTDSQTSRQMSTPTMTPQRPSRAPSTRIWRTSRHKRQQQSTSMQRRQMHLSSSSPRTRCNYINNSKP